MVDTALHPSPAAAAERPALLPRRLRRVDPPRWWQELLLVAIGYLLYSLVRNAVPAHEVAARHRALDILSAERPLHLDVERSLNQLVAHHSWLAYACNYYYATLHFFVTVGLLVWLYRRHPLRYRALRTALFATNLVALVGFWLYALAPPRMLPGYVDTVVAFHTWGSWGSSGVDSASNQFAAMPSLHVGWSLWSALAVAAVARRRWVRVAAFAYPLTTAFVVIGTANHFVLDAVGGVVALAVGLAAQRVLTGRPALTRRTPARRPHAPAA